MSDLRCPMCGKDNPQELEVCQFCEARLKPLTAPPPQESPKTPAPEETTPPGKPPEPDEGAADWLSDLRHDSQFGADDLDDSEDDLGEEGETWMPPMEAGAQPAPPDEEDFLARLSDSFQEEGVSPPTPEEEQGPVDDFTPDLPTDLPDSQEAPAETPEEDDLPDWLQSVAGEFSAAETDQPGESSEEPPQPDSEADLPDWLATEPAEVEGAGEEALFDPDEGVLSEEDIEPGQPAQNDLSEPEWLPEFDEVAAAPTEEEQEVPEWLDAAVEPPVTLQEEDLPEWMQGLQGVQTEPDRSVPDELMANLERSVSPFTAEGEDELPDWLADLQAKSPEVSAQVEGESPTLEFEESILGDEAPEFELQPPRETPEWLAGITLDGELSEEEIEEDISDIELEPAELPGWLKAIRPVEAVAPLVPPIEPEERGVEGAGPLAGLEGVLSAEPEVAQAGTPPIFSTRVDVSENQENQAAMLKEMVELEAESIPVKAPLVVIQPQRLLRWAIALCLLLAVGFPIVVGSRAVALPTPERNPDVVIFRGLIEALPTSAQVLMAVEYQPGLSGELEVVASAVIDHLQVRGGRLTMISTSPTGPALAENLLADEGALGWEPGEDYVNLGFVPGGAAGLLNFAIQPQQTKPSGFNPQGLPDAGIWAAPPLGGIQSLSDFDQVIVVVDDPDTARMWIEQVQPRLVGSPLMMVASAQADPLIRPYYEANPPTVAGMLTGLPSGAAYAEGLNLDGSQPIRDYWDGFNNGLILATVLIAIGVLYNLAIVLIRRQGLSDRRGQD